MYHTKKLVQVFLSAQRIYFNDLHILSCFRPKRNLHSTTPVVKGQSELGLMQTLGSKQGLREQLYCRLIPQTPFYSLL